jgi:hypothetical protein
MSVSVELLATFAHLASAYFSELERALQYIRDTTDLSIDEKRKFFKRANINLGQYVLHLW